MGVNSDKEKEVENVIIGNYMEMEKDESKPTTFKTALSNLLWHGGSTYDAWFSCASNQVIFPHYISIS